MRIRELIEKLPTNVMKEIERIRKEYKLHKDDKCENGNCKAGYWYTKGLSDAGLITERERQLLFIYTTV